MDAVVDLVGSESIAESSDPAFRQRQPGKDLYIDRYIYMIDGVDIHTLIRMFNDILRDV